MHRLIEKYGKDMVGELLDIIIIKQKINNSDFRDFLIKYKIIKKTTKCIRVFIMKRDNEYSITAKNGRHTTVMYHVITKTDINQIMEELNNEIKTHLSQFASTYYY